MTNVVKRRFVMARLCWLIEDPPSVPTAAITAYPAQSSLDDLFSVYVKFAEPSSETGHWQSAKIYALFDEMASRFPPAGAKLILTSGAKPVAEAEVVSFGEDELA